MRKRIAVVTGMVIAIISLGMAAAFAASSGSWDIRKDSSRSYGSGSVNTCIGRYAGSTPLYGGKITATLTTYNGTDAWVDARNDGYGYTRLITRESQGTTGPKTWCIGPGDTFRISSLSMKFCENNTGPWNDCSTRTWSQ